jgi:hypothetical protein
MDMTWKALYLNCQSLKLVHILSGKYRHPAKEIMPLSRKRPDAVTIHLFTESIIIYDKLTDKEPTYRKLS